MYYLLFVLFTYAGDQHDFHVILCWLSFNSNVTGVTSGAGYPSRPPDVSPQWLRVLRFHCDVLWIVVCFFIYNFVPLFLTSSSR